jgi:hypothetical protein
VLLFFAGFQMPDLSFSGFVFASRTLAVAGFSVRAGKKRRLPWGFIVKRFNYGEGYGDINTKGRRAEAVAERWGSCVWNDFYGPYV